jgi:hypothetical protein
MGITDQRCRQPIHLGHGPDPTGGVGELAGCDRVLPDHRELGVSCLPGGHGALGPASKEPRPTGRVAELRRCPGAQGGPDRARRGVVFEDHEPGRHRGEVRDPHRPKDFLRQSGGVCVTGWLATTVLYGSTDIQGDPFWSTVPRSRFDPGTRFERRRGSVRVAVGKRRTPPGRS